MKQIITLIIVSILLFGVSACGKKGELKPPPTYQDK